MKIGCFVLLLTGPVWGHLGHGESVPVASDQGISTRPLHDENRVTIRVEGDRRIIESNGIPDHPTGRFPSRDNPNTIRKQTYRFTLPIDPRVAWRPIPLRHQAFGVALNGVVFDPSTAEFYQNRRGSEWNYEAIGGVLRLGLDGHHAHVQPNGAYHYHGLPTALFEKLSGGRKQMTLIGWAADGFPIYGLYGFADARDAKSKVVELRSSFRLKRSFRPSGAGKPGGRPDGSFTSDYEYVPGLGDLDECNGRQGVTPEFPEGTYHYVLTADFPFIPRSFRGTPDPSFGRRGGPAGRGPRQALRMDSPSLVHPRREERGEVTDPPEPSPRALPPGPPPTGSPDGPPGGPPPPPAVSPRPADPRTAHSAFAPEAASVRLPG